MIRAMAGKGAGGLGVTESGCCNLLSFLGTRPQHLLVPSAGSPARQPPSASLPHASSGLPSVFPVPFCACSCSPGLPGGSPCYWRLLRAACPVLSLPRTWPGRLGGPRAGLRGSRLLPAVWDSRPGGLGPAPPRRAPACTWEDFCVLAGTRPGDGPGNTGWACWSASACARGARPGPKVRQGQPHSLKAHPTSQPAPGTVRAPNSPPHSIGGALGASLALGVTFNINTVIQWLCPCSLPTGCGSGGPGAEQGPLSCQVGPGTSLGSEQGWKVVATAGH